MPKIPGKEKLLVDKEYVLKKFPGKGGWTYAELPEIPKNPHAHFGWVIVKGSIESHSFSRYHLASMGNGSLFFPVNAAVRKKIRKQAGDRVRIVLYEDHSAVTIPQELEECLQTEPEVYAKFMSLPDHVKETHIKKIFAAKRSETRAERIVKLMEELFS